MLESIISSQAKRDVLLAFLSSPDVAFYQRQLAQVTRHPIRAVQREIATLLAGGIIVKNEVNDRSYYRINTALPVYKELRSLIMKTAGAPAVIGESLQGLENIVCAFIFGSCARGDDRSTSDIDLMVIGDISSRAISGALRRARTVLHREINYVVYDEREIVKRVNSDDPFFAEILAGKKEFVRGGNDDIAKIVTRR